VRIFTTGVSNIAQSWISENGIILVGITVRLDQHEERAGHGQHNLENQVRYGEAGHLAE